MHARLQCAVQLYAYTEQLQHLRFYGHLATYFCTCACGDPPHSRPLPPYGLALMDPRAVRANRPTPRPPSPRAEGLPPPAAPGAPDR